MKVFIPILALLDVVAATPELHAKWSAYKTTHGKDYASHIEPVRLEAFAENVRHIEEHNAKFERGEVSYELGLNEHSDLSEEEFAEANFGLAVSEEYRANANVSKHVSMPGASYIDWSTQNYVSPVKRQSPCGSCYAFTAVALFESYMLMEDEYEGALSEQDIIDCSFHKYYGTTNDGCKGGDVLYSLEDSIERGLALESLYNYTSKRTKRPGICKTDVQRMTLSQYEVVEVDGNETEFASALRHGPLAVTLNGENKNFKQYKRGIYNYSGCDTKPNHAVLLVGSGKSNGQEYWIIKNSWGTSWGEQGYMRLIKGINRCGIATWRAFYLRHT